MIRDFKDLLIWQKGILIAEQCYLLTQSFPKEEIYGITSQIRRASVSIPANIAEGYGRNSKGDYIRFLNIAKGSVNELETHLILSTKLKFCDRKNVEPIINLLHEEVKMIISLIKKLSL